MAATQLAKLKEDPRLAELLELHTSVLKRLGQKQRELGRFNDECDELRMQLVEFLLPIEAKGRSLDEAIHLLFENILARKRSKRAKGEIKSLYWQLQLVGTISPRLPDQALPGSSSSPSNPFPPAEAIPPAEPFFEENAPAPETLRSEPHRGRGDDKKNLRSLFLKLAAALHPDKVQDDQEKKRRTQLMKELNRAYQDGDVARIIEIESRLDIGSLAGEDHDPEDVIERRCRVLRTQYELLGKQYNEVLDDLLEARRSMLGEAVIEVRRNKRARLANPLCTIIDPMQESIDYLQKVHDHVEGFSTGKTNLEDFLESPILYKGEDFDDDNEYDENCNCPECVAMREDECDCDYCREEQQAADRAVLSLLGFGPEQAPEPKIRPSKKVKNTRKRQKAARKKNRKKRK